MADLNVKVKQKENIEKLAIWVGEQKHLPDIPEKWLIQFLHSCYYDLEASKVTIDKFCTRRARMHEVSPYRTIETLKASLNTFLFAALPLSPEGYSVLYFRFLDLDDRKFNFFHACASFDLFGLWTIQNLGTTPGFLMVIETQGVGWRHFWQTHFKTVANYIAFLQEGCPVRMKGIHILNPGFLVYKFLSIVQKCVKNELMDILKVHINMDSFYQVYPREKLPVDLGGQNGTILELKNKAFQIIDEMEDEILKSNEYVADLSLIN